MFIDTAKRILNLKLVYYGPGLSGKTTNMKWLHTHAPHNKSKLVSLSTETDRTLFFDFMPLDIGKLSGFTVRLHLYTVPGQVFYEATRKLVVAGADAVAFVADSQHERMDANIESLENLKTHLQSHRLDLRQLPYIVQCNKRDLPDVMSVEEMRRGLNFKGETFIEATAERGAGVLDTLRLLTKDAMINVRQANQNMVTAVTSTFRESNPMA